MKLTSIKQVYEKLVHIQNLLETQNENFFDIEQASNYLGVKKSYLYSLIHKKQLPYYKPGGKKVYLSERELQEWIKRSRTSSINEFSERSSDTNQ